MFSFKPAVSAMRKLVQIDENNNAEIKSSAVLLA